eukprot:TRINITY_DN906_c0_g1_i1.p1 TRINITY_DN906_c0_g1~~TRINITY_DN906_c0_g1_i1.p1  ORF type:complete len:343 (+),score=42.50 TRINITY_DN906_c0_g1_i1:87-1115(+)
MLLEELPTEILIYIFSLLTHYEQIRLSGISRTFQLIVKHPYLWTQLSIFASATKGGYYYLSIEKKKILEQRYDIIFVQDPYPLFQHIYSINCLNLLEDLEFITPQWSQSIKTPRLTFLQHPSPALKRLSFPNFPFTAEELSVLSTCKSLTSLNIANCPNVKIQNMPIFESVESLVLNRGNLKSGDLHEKILDIQHKFPKLRRLNLANHREFGTVSIKCALCQQVLFPDLQDYYICPPSQTQIEFEIFTNIPPVSALSTSLRGIKGKQLNCEKNCHRLEWLVDHNSGFIYNYCFEYAISYGTHLAVFGGELDSNVLKTTAIKNLVTASRTSLNMLKHESETNS